MNKIFTILRHEFLSIITKPSFWVGLLVVPIISGVVFGIIVLTSGLATAAAIASQQAAAKVPQGYVDLSGVIQPQYFKVETPLTLYQDPSTATNAMNAGEISGYYLVPVDYLDTGKVTFISNQFSPFEDSSKTEDFQRAIQLSLLKGDAETLEKLSNVVDETRTSLAPDTGARNSDGFAVLPFVTCMLFCMVLISASSYLMRTVSTEKENRVMEVLMSSASPSQLLMGKVLGLGLLGLIQMGLWLSSAISIANNPVVAAYVGPIRASAVAWSLAYFVLGYLIYACLMAGLGALMPGTKEAGQYVFFVMLPLLIPLYLNSAINNEPNGLLATALSLIPFTSPVVMPMRLVSGEVPTMQVLIGLLLLFVAVLGVIWVAARVFRAQSLLAGSKPTLRQLVAAVR